MIPLLIHSNQKVTLCNYFGLYLTPAHCAWISHGGLHVIIRVSKAWLSDVHVPTIGIIIQNSPIPIPPSRKGWVWCILIDFCVLFLNSDVPIMFVPCGLPCCTVAFTTLKHITFCF